MVSTAQPIPPANALQLAEQHKAAGRLGAAETLLKQLLATAPNYHPAWHTLGLIAYEVGKLELAIKLIQKAIALSPTPTLPRGERGQPPLCGSSFNPALYHRNLGEMCRRLGRLEEAVAAGQRACALAPNDVDAHYNLGLALTDKCEWDSAIRSYQRALALNPQHGLAWNNLGAALEKQGDKRAAELAYAKAVILNPAHHEAQNNLGAIYSEQGKLDEASHCFDAAIEANPDFSEAHFNLSTLKTYRADDPHLIYLERILDNAAAMPVAARIRYWFALGKAREDVGRYDDAFAAYEAGNRLQHEILPCDEARADEMLERVMTVFDRAFFEARMPSPPAPLPLAGEESKAPIFIVGMPRSGTTLLEQILSSHPAVYGAGELTYLNEAIMDLPGGSGERFPDFVPGLAAEDFAQLGKTYAERLWKLAPDALRITDKMPANFFYIGMIRLALPNAKIIHAMRDPMDSCFSNYARLFNDTMEFTYDLGTLGRYYARYITLMQHWRAVLPQGSILDLRYEDMVADTEGQARRILDYVDLPWDDNCLAFHQNKRHVKTASVAQVRKPIYKTSVARWQHFEKQLQPLLRIVQPYRNL
ncbi:tetratricopeptide repeat-containing sulfotransferase family protein [Ferrigenium sp. UT5]|uniref:tetratricopeptide repeat-containing sulfotransferase family protein n=1 Tax=Ferrigenium sp. UT5 TaxID=3242105 RepID=UPI003553DE76